MNDDEYSYYRRTNATQPTSDSERLLSHRRDEDLSQEIRVNTLVIYDALERCSHATRLELFRKQLIQSDPHRLHEKSNEHLVYHHPTAGDKALGHPEKARKASSCRIAQKLFQHLHVPRLFAGVVSKAACLARILDASRLLNQHLNASPLEDNSDTKYAQNLRVPIPRSCRNLCERKRILLSLDKDTIPALGLECALHATSTEESRPKSIDPFDRIARWPCG